MALSPKKFREMVVQMLYALEMSGHEEGLSDLMQEELKVNRRYANEARECAREVFEKRASFDEEIRRFSSSFELERIGKMERSILRYALFEVKTLPKAIVIAEAIRLTTKFCTKEAASFVHALLDTILEGKSDATFCA